MQFDLYTTMSVKFVRVINWPAAVIAALGFMALPLATLAQDRSNTDKGPDVGTPSQASPEDPRQPRWHFRVRGPAILSDDEAKTVYERMKWRLSRRYKLSLLPVTRHYQRWRRYNTVPYRSTTHGARYVNNFANARAAAYGRFEMAGRLPEGAILAKDSLTVKRDGQVMPGPLFVMEKMSEGFNYVSGDWRYTMIMPDGSIFGETKGTGSERVKFCISCHLAAEKNDHLFFLPQKYRKE